jgi:hypothetical protein
MMTWEQHTVRAKREVPAIDWTQADLARNRSAYLRAKAEFISSNGFEPSSSADYASIFRRQAVILKGAL